MSANGRGLTLLAAHAAAALTGEEPLQRKSSFLTLTPPLRLRERVGRSPG